MNKKLYINLAVIIVLCIGFGNIKAQQPLVKLQKSNPISNRVDSLLNLMTLEEKIGQLNLLTPGGGVATGEVVSKDVEGKIKAGNVGGLFGVTSPERVRQAQEIAVKESRLGIPLLIGSDVIHGYKTTFPIPLGTAASWDMEMIEKTAAMAAKESTADGINWNFSPMVDISRDPRWGRVAEGAGEDPYLGSEIAKAVVRGYQQDDMRAPHTMMATVKHFALYGASEAGRDYNTTDMSRITMFNYYMPPYKAAVDAGVGSIMSSFNDIEGIPASGSKWLLTDVLRTQWGFDGFVVSDYTSVNEMIAHGMGDLQAVSAMSLKAGLDMDMVGEGFLTTLMQSVEEGKVTEEEITQAARRILEAKDRLGLLENPYLYSDVTRPAKDILSKENRELARKAATSSFVLLKKQDNMLPLKKDAKIALIGPLANDQNNMLGTWAPTGDFKLSIPILQGIKNVAPNAQVVYAKGANITDDAAFAEKINVFGPRAVIDERTPETMLDEAMKTVDGADVIVAVVGEASEMSGESANRTNLDIPESQKKLIRALVATGKPVVLVLMSGRPLTIVEEMSLPVNILQVWFPGVEAGNAIADVLFGDYNPAGRLPVTFYKSLDQLPPFEDYRMENRTYRYFKGEPLYPFGYGLSYTTFTYSDLRITPATIKAGQGTSVQVTVENTGSMAGDEVVQLYLTDLEASVPVPIRSLQGFKRIHLAPGERQTVSFTPRPYQMAVVDYQGQRIVEPGNFLVAVGGGMPTGDSQAKGQVVTGIFSVVGERTPVEFEY